MGADTLHCIVESRITSMTRRRKHSITTWDPERPVTSMRDAQVLLVHTLSPLDHIPLTDEVEAELGVTYDRDGQFTSFNVYCDESETVIYL